MYHLLNALCISILLTLTGCSNLSDYPTLNAPVKDGYVAIANGRLYYQVVGKGDPVIVIHGGPGLDQGHLLPGMAALASLHQVVFYDQRGSGRSNLATIDEQSISIEQFVEDLETLRRTLGYQKVTLIGHSWGGMIAMRYAIKYGVNVTKMILMNTMPATSAGMHDFVENVLERIEPSAKELESLQKSSDFLNGDAKAISKYYGVIYKYYFHKPEDLAKLNLNLFPTGAATGVQVAKLLEKLIFTNFVDITDDLKTLKIPTLVIHGTSDVLPQHTAEEIAKAIKDSKLVVLQQCGHFPYIEKPQEWLQATESFLAK